MMRSCAMLPSISSSVEKKVYFRVEKYPQLCDRRGVYEWYAIPNHNNFEGTPDEKDLETLKPVFEFPCDSSYYMCGMAAWKTHIYVMGGCKWIPHNEHPPVSNVYYIDTLRPELGWQPGPDLESPRRGTYGVVLNGKICALGGVPKKFIRSYGESLQPLSTQNWLSMDVDHEGAPLAIFGHALFSDKLFAYGLSGALNCYDFKDKKWSVIEEDFDRWENQCASIDEIMYLVEGGKFMGFDLQTHKWYEVVGLKEDSMLPPFCNELKYWGLKSSLVHIGNGTLCLLWNDCFSLDHADIHCTIFTVFKKYDDAHGCIVIKADVNSYKIYRVNGGFLADAVVVHAGEESDHDKEKEMSEEITKEEEEEEEE